MSHLKNPRTVRNFWIDADIDGRRNLLAGGPKGKEGGMSLTLYQRSQGSVVAALTLSCLCGSGGELSVEVVPLLPLEAMTDSQGLRIKTKR